MVMKLMLRMAQDVRVGDMLTIYTGDAAHEYVVMQRMVLREAGQTLAQRLVNARWIGSFEDERVTLVTCYPAWANTHRLVLIARPR